jgi:hypothetical protein
MKISSRMRTHILALSVGALIASFVPPRVYAVVITTCGTTCGSSCELGNNIECGSGQSGVTLTNGASLDMKGHYIWCDVGAGGNCSSGVVMAGNGSAVFTSVNPIYSAVPAGILGNWSRGVDCATKPGSGVSGIMFRGVFGDAAIYNCQAVLGNTITEWPDPVFTGPDQSTGAYVEWPHTCIVHHSISNADIIQDNRIDGCNTSVQSIGTLKLEFSFNNVNCHDLEPPLSGVPPCINFGTAARAGLVANNVIVGDTRGVTIQTPASGVTFQNNVCKVGVRSCQQCVDQNKCVSVGSASSP